MWTREISVISNELFLYIGLFVWYYIFRRQRHFAIAVENEQRRISRGALDHVFVFRRRFQLLRTQNAAVISTRNILSLIRLQIPRKIKKNTNHAVLYNNSNTRLTASLCVIVSKVIVYARRVSTTLVIIFIWRNA